MSIAVEADTETLMRQAGYTAAEYMDAGIKQIDGTFGKGYAKKHPELLGAFMLTASQDYQAAMIVVASQNIEASLDSIASEIGSR